MNGFLLPGNSPRHAEWVEHLKDALEPAFESTVIQHYQHWQTGEEWANVDHEIAVAREKTKDLEPYTIIGKSIGTVIATKGTVEGTLHPEKLILLGVPINGGAAPGPFAEWLRRITVPVTIVQNHEDPLGSFADVHQTFAETGDHVSFVEMPGETHDYLDFDAISKLL